MAGREKVVSSRGNVRAGRETVYLTLYEASKETGIGYQTLSLAVKAKPPKGLKVARWVQVGAKRSMPMISKADLASWTAKRNTRSRIGPKTVEKYAAYFGLDKATGMKLRERFVETGKPNQVEIP